MIDSLTELHIDGLLIRATDHHCEKPTCEMRTLVAAWEDEDRWCAVGESLPFTDHWTLDVEAHFDEPELRDSADRMIAGFGIPWDDLTFPILRSMTKMVEESPRWFGEEFMHYTPAEFRRLRDVIADDQGGFVEALRMLRTYRLGVQ